jgi:CRISPR-associated protein Csh1
LCNEYKIVTEKPKFTKAGSALGYYITDKVGFSCELSGDFSKNFILCRDCYMCLLAGETFVRNRLKSNIGGLSVYIIPKFIMPMSFSSEKLQNWAEYIKVSFNSFRSLIGLREFEERLREYMEFEEIKNSFILNLLFWKKGIGAEFKILKLIKDVPPSRIELLQRVGNQIKDIADQLLGEANQWKIDLQGIYYLIPLRRTKVEIIEYRKLLQLYDAIFSAKSVSYKFLIQQFVELAGVYRFEKFDAYNIGRQQPDLGIAYSMLKANILLLYLKRLTILTGGGGNMDYANLDVDEGMRNFVREMEYDEPKVALFLLGYLIGEIGNAQYREGNSKPILGKITYQGMNQNKLVRLLNDVFEKLTQYKSGGKPLLHYSEGIFAECKRLLDKTIQEPLSDQENVFYVLSGYAYATHQAIKASQSKEAKKEEEVETNE